MELFSNSWTQTKATSFIYSWETDLIGIVYSASSSCLSSFVHHVVRDVKLDAQEKLSVLTTFNRFIGLRRVSLM